ncbi:hypothetical protein ACSVIJ_04820 [Pseudomonas sp. NCHU5208]|uniref:hypothetical protein n=1 Tax=unclassified Pseudomonas TaxID=196821 RepID=UPI003F9CE69E
MIGDLVFVHGTKPKPAYLLDCFGNLVRCSAEGNPEALLPYSVDLVSTSSELLNPNPWTITVESLVSRIRFVAEASGEILDAYPGVEIPRINYPFVPRAMRHEDDEVVEQALDLLPTLSGQDEQGLLAMLREVGVHQIPHAERFVSTIHEAAGGSLTAPPLEEISAGWISNSKVYRKAVVRSAQVGQNQ